MWVVYNLGIPRLHAAQYGRGTGLMTPHSSQVGSGAWGVGSAPRNTDSQSSQHAARFVGEAQGFGAIRSAHKPKALGNEHHRLRFSQGASGVA